MVSGGNINLWNWLVILATPICIFGIAVFGAVVGWGLEILRRRQATLLILFGMCMACAYIGLFLLRVPIQQRFETFNRFGPIPTVQATAVPIPTEQLSRGSRE